MLRYDFENFVNFKKYVRNIIFNRDNLQIWVQGKEGTEQTIAKESEKFFNFMQRYKPTTEIVSGSSIDFKPECSQTFIHSDSVILEDGRYIADCIATVPATHQDFAVLMLAATLLTQSYLIDLAFNGDPRTPKKNGNTKIGHCKKVGATQTTFGTFCMVSENDTFLVETLRKFNSIVPWLKDGKYTDKVCFHKTLLTI